MSVAAEAEERDSGRIEARGHRLWVRLTHWLISIAVIVLIYSGITILMVHPRLYWGNGGNDLVAPLLKIPLGPNKLYGSWTAPESFFNTSGGPVSASRLAEPWNENAWARSLHFLAAWVFAIGLVAYLVLGVATGHLRRAIWPPVKEMGRGQLWHDVVAHFPPAAGTAKVGPPYGIVQKLTYALVVLLALPLVFLTGVTMSPAITADYPILLDIFGGTQSARTIHFFTFAFVALFLLMHLSMVLLTGPLRQLRAMVTGN